MLASSSLAAQGGAYHLAIHHITVLTAGVKIRHSSFWL